VYSYFRKIEKYVFLAGFIFVFFVLTGYSLSSKDPLISQKVLSNLNPIVDFLFQLSKTEIFFVIFINNSLKTFVSIILGIGFGIFPFLLLAINGFIFGAIFFYFEPFTFFIAVAPHGVLELIAVFFGSGIGLYLGSIFTKSKRKKINLKQEIYLGCKFFLIFILPALFLAALIETFITPLVITHIIP